MSERKTPQAGRAPTVDRDGVRRYTDRALVRRLAGELRPYRLHVGGLFFLSLLAAPLALLIPVPLAVTVDTVLGSQPLPGFLASITPAAIESSEGALLVAAAAMFVLIALLTQLQSMSTTVLRAYTGERIMLDFRARLFRHVQRLSLSYHDARGTSDSTYRIQYDATAVQYFATETLSSFVTAAFTLVAMLYVTALIDWQLALVAIAVAPPLLII
jgi:ATP-binding cassette, subfamily B, bacterial